MHGYYNYNKDFINKFTTPSLHKKSLINNIVNKIDFIDSIAQC